MNPLDFIKKANAPVKVNPLDFVSKSRTTTPKGYEITGKESGFGVSPKISSAVDEAARASGVIYEAPKNQSMLSRFGSALDTTLKSYTSELFPQVGEHLAGFARGSLGLITDAGDILNFISRQTKGTDNDIGNALRSVGEQARNIFETKKSKAYKEEGVPFSLEKMNDPRFWSSEFFEMVPLTLGFLGAAKGTLGITNLALKSVKSPLIRGIVGTVASSGTMRGMESALEAEQTYHTAVQKGMGEEQAVKASSQTFIDNMKLIGYDAAEIIAALQPFKALKNPFGKSIIGKILGTAAGVGVSGFLEGAEEVYQTKASQEALGEEFSYTSPESKQSFILGALSGLVFGVGGRVAEDDKKATEQYFDKMGENLPTSSAGYPTDGTLDEKQNYLENVAANNEEEIRVAVEDIESEYQSNVSEASFKAGELNDALEQDINDALQNAPADEVRQTVKQVLVEKGIPEKSADDAVSTVLDMFTSDNDDVMSAVKAAEEAVKSTQKEEISTQKEEKSMQEDVISTQKKINLPNGKISARQASQGLKDAGYTSSEINEILTSTTEAKIGEETDKGFYIAENIIKNTRYLENRGVIGQKKTEEEMTFEDQIKEKFRKEEIEKAVEETYKKATTRKDDITTPEGATKDMIRGYVERGDTIESLIAGQMGVGGGSYDAQIGGYLNGKRLSNDKVLVKKIGGKEVNAVVSLKKVFDEIKAEMSTEAVAKDGEGAIIEANGKRDNKDIGRGVSDRGVSESSGEDETRPEGDGRGGAIDREGVARGEGDTSLPSAGERLSTPVKAKISKLEADLQEVYQNTPVLEEIDGVKYTAADIGLSNIAQELAMAEPGYRYQDANLEFKGVSSTFPSWMPENARTKEDIEYVLEAFNDVGSAHYPQDPRATAKRALADAVFDGIDFHAGVDTSAIRKQILELYEKGEDALTPEELAGEYNAEDIRRYDRVKKDAKERQESTGLESGDIETIINKKTVVFPSDGAVEIAAGEEITNKDLEVVSQFVPAGGMEKQGAEGRGLLDEYYTPPDVTAAVGSILEDMGVFREGMRILEPAAGTGNFLGDLPEMEGIDAYEINETAAKIAKMSYPHVKVFNKPFENFFMGERGEKKQFAPEYDLVIGNPPYGEHRGKYKGLGEEVKIAKYEEYFLKRALDLTKEGGHVAMVVPSGFLRSGVSNSKINIGLRGDLVEAYRLPNGTFETTDIGTDILIFKKKDYLSDTAKPTVQVLVDDTYFKDNPDRILGEQGERAGKFGPEQFVKGDLNSAIDALYKQRGQDFGEKVAGEAVDEKELEAIGGEGLFAYKPTVYAETYKERGLEALEAKEPTPIYERAEEGGETLDLATYSIAEGDEVEMWKYVTATGELDGDFDKNKAYFYNGKYYNKFNYLQGDVYEKLDQLEKDSSSLSTEQYEKQKKDIQSIMPERVTVERMSVSPNARFAVEFYLNKTDEAAKNGLSNHFLGWVRKLPHSALGESSYYNIEQYVDNVPVRGGDKLQNEKNRKTRRIEGDRLFKLYLKDELSKENQVKVEEEYNRKFNAYARPNYREVPLVSKTGKMFNGKPLDIREVQLQGVGFLVNRGVGLLAHDVGVGKTMQAIIAVNETMKRGWAKRPLIVVPSVSVYNQWINEINQLIPDAKITLLANLGGDFKGDLKTLEIPEGTISMITEEGFKRLGFTDETYNELTADFQDVIEQPADSKTKRAEAKGEAQAEEVIGKGMRGTRVDRFFEDLGFDMIVGDEIHNANHIVAKAKMEEGSGKVSEFRNFQTKPSLYGIKMWLATQYVLKKNNNRNIILLSATPFTNNPLEYYSILSLMARERMKRMGIFNVNDFMTMFMDIVSSNEFRADGKYSEKNEVRSFKNYQQFQKLLTEFIDFRDGVEAGVKRPDRVGKEYVVGETVQASEFKDAAQELFKDKNAGTLKAINELRAIAFSPFLSRYYKGSPPTAKEFVEGSPKIKTAVELIRQSIKDRPEAGHLIYSTIGVEYFPLIRAHLISELGFSENEVQIISGATAKEKRSTIQENFNAGKVKIVLGSDAIQEGVNLQRNSTDLYVLSLPWNFTSLRQVIGRVWRQGNKWPRVRVNSIFTENSIDTFLSQKLQNKEKRYEEALKFKGDTLDVGDIDFEEMKFDLITDPVARAELEYKFKEQEAEHEINTIKSERAYKNRKAGQYIEDRDKLEQYREYARKEPDQTWWQDSVKNWEKKVATEAKSLKDRGFDLENLEKDLNETDAKIAALEAQKENLKTEKEKALKEAADQRVDTLSVRETDYSKFIGEREEENGTFYDRAEPMFERIAEPVFSKKPVTDIPNIGVTDEEKEAVMVFYAQSGRMTPDIKPLVESAIKKYNDYMGAAQKEANDAYFEVMPEADMEMALNRAANDIGKPFNMTQFNAENFMKVLFGDSVALRFRAEPGVIDLENGEVALWGSYTPNRVWRNPLIRVVANKGMVQSTVLYHEAFHAFIDTQMTKVEKADLINNIAKNPATLPARLLAKRDGYTFAKTAEEWLAEDFARYAAGQQHLTANDKLYLSWTEKIRGWIRKTTGAEMVYNKILAQLPKPTIDIKTNKREQARSVLEEYQKRLNVKFDIDFADVIFTGEYNKEGKPTQARAATYNDKITLTENLRELTAHHEITHLVAHNIEKISVFAGITEKELLRAVNGGKDYTSNDITKLHEGLAVGFENYVAGRQQKQATILGRFYQQLLDVLTELYTALGGDINVVQNFYKKLATAKGGEEVVLKSDRLLDTEVQRFSKEGEVALDFREQDRLRRKMFDEITSSVPFGDASEILIKKDINFVENWVAQARDIYLKDPNEFGAAKLYENVGDSRRMKKQALDIKFSKILEPYTHLKGGNMERVNNILMQGDKKAVEYDENDLKGFGLGEIEIKAYKAVRQAFNIGHQLLLTEMANKGVPIEEIAEYQKTRVGYMPHKWPHRFVVKTQEIETKGNEQKWKTSDMASFPNERAAKKAFEQMRKDNAGNTQKRFLLDTLDNLNVDFFSQQGLSFEALKSVVQQARTGEEVKAKMLEAVRNMFKEKGFGRNFLYRTGVQGYEAKEMPHIIASYFAGMDGFLTKMEAAKKYYDILSTVDARRQSNYYNWLRDAVAYDLGQTREFNWVKRAAFTWYLANDISFLLVNATQNWTIGVGELSKYTKGDITKPERALIKATTDWWRGHITPDEKKIIDGLVALGALGGEQIAELANIKNNPLYSEISSRFNKIMYASTSFVERSVNRVPAFLAARRILIESGMGPKEANEKALEISDDIHFRYGKQHRPRFMRGGLGTFFIFNHYARSMLYMLYRDLGAKNYAVFARKMIYTVTLGGTASLPFASLLILLFKKIFGAGGDDEEEEEMGKWETAIKYGLPAGLTDIDLSQRVGLEFIGVNSILESPTELKSWVGIIGSGVEKVVQTYQLAAQDRWMDALAKIMPDMIGNPIRGYTGYKWGVRSFAGTPLEDADGDVYKYNSWEAIIKATGFSPIQEKLRWNAKSNKWASDDAEQAERTRLRRDIQFKVQKGDFEGARALQAQAIAEEIISEKTDYVREFGKDTFFGNALKAIEGGESLKAVEKDLITNIYGEDASDAQRNNARKDLAVYRSYGTKNKYANDLMSASTNKEKVEVLKKAKAEMSEEEFKDFYKKGRKTISTESGNPSRILISDDVNSMFNASK